MATPIDPQDVATVEALRPLIEVVQAAMPAVIRLAHADYPGAGELMADLEGYLDHIAESLEGMIYARGDEAAYDYFFYVLTGKRSVLSAYADIINDMIGPTPEGFSRADALTRYAATVKETNS